MSLDAAYDAETALSKFRFADVAFAMTFLESKFEEALSDSGLEFEKLGWDYYDASLEIYDVPNDARLSEAQQKIIWDAGFGKVYVNHLDKWETHYSWKTDAFQAVRGWRRFRR